MINSFLKENFIPSLWFSVQEKMIWNVYIWKNEKNYYMITWNKLLTLWIRGDFIEYRQMTCKYFSMSKLSLRYARRLTQTKKRESVFNSNQRCFCLDVPGGAYSPALLHVCKLSRVSRILSNWITTTKFNSVHLGHNQTITFPKNESKYFL